MSYFDNIPNEILINIFKQKFNNSNCALVSRKFHIITSEMIKCFNNISNNNFECESIEKNDCCYINFMNKHIKITDLDKLIIYSIKFNKLDIFKHLFTKRYLSNKNIKKFIVIDDCLDQKFNIFLMIIKYNRVDMLKYLLYETTMRQYFLMLDVYFCASYFLYFNRQICHSQITIQSCDHEIIDRTNLCISELIDFYKINNYDKYINLFSSIKFIHNYQTKWQFTINKLIYKLYDKHIQKICDNNVCSYMFYAIFDSYMRINKYFLIHPPILNKFGYANITYDEKFSQEIYNQISNDVINVD